MNIIELELTYLAASLPKDLASFDYTRIIDVYFPSNIVHPTLRARQRGEKCEITKKEMVDGNDSSQMLEQTIPLSPEEFTELTAGGGKRVAKRRYKYPWNGHIAEIDVFEEDLSGLVVVDFEFADRQTQLAFSPPDFCLIDVTQDEEIAGGMLAGKRYEELTQYLKTKNYHPLTLITEE